MRSLGIIIDDVSNQPVCISSRPGSSGRSRSPRGSSPRRNRDRQNSNELKAKIPKSISSKNLSELTNDRFNHTEVILKNKQQELSFKKGLANFDERISGSNNFES